MANDVKGFDYRQLQEVDRGEEIREWCEKFDSNNDSVITIEEIESAAIDALNNSNSHRPQSSFEWEHKFGNSYENEMGSLKQVAPENLQPIISYFNRVTDSLDVLKGMIVDSGYDVKGIDVNDNGVLSISVFDPLFKGAENANFEVTIDGSCQLYACTSGTWDVVESRDVMREGHTIVKNGLKQIQKAFERQGIEINMIQVDDGKIRIVTYDKKNRRLINNEHYINIDWSNAKKSFADIARNVSKDISKIAKGNDPKYLWPSKTITYNRRVEQYLRKEMSVFGSVQIEDPIKSVKVSGPNIIEIEFKRPMLSNRYFLKAVRNAIKLASHVEPKRAEVSSSADNKSHKIELLNFRLPFRWQK